MPAELTEFGPLAKSIDQEVETLDSAMIDVFGNTIDVSANSYTGRQNKIIARSITQLGLLTVETVKALDPDSAQGRQLDAIGALMDEPRKPATRSTIPATLIGLPGIPVGDKRVRYVRAGLESIWRTSALDPLGNPLAITANGLLETTLTAAETGPVEAFTDGTDQWVIVDEVAGWEALESTADRSLGVPAQSDPEYRVSIRLAGRGSGIGTVSGAQRTILRVPGVTSLRLLNNRELFPVAGVAGKSTEAIVDGGDSTAVGQAMFDSYGGTDGFTGTLAVTAFDFLGLPHEVKYTPVTLINVVVSISIDTTGAEVELPDDALNTITTVTAAWIGTPGTPGGLDEGINVQPDDIEGQIRNALPAGSVPENQVVVSIGLKGGAAPVAVPYIIDLRQRAITFSTAQAAKVVGTEVQPFQIVVTWVLDIAVDNGNVQNITFAVAQFPNTSDVSAFELASVINDQVTGFTAGSSLGSLTLTSDTIGGGSEINILLTTSVDLLTALGLVTGSVFGSDGDITTSII